MTERLVEPEPVQATADPGSPHRVFLSRWKREKAPRPVRASQQSTAELQALSEACTALLAEAARAKQLLPVSSDPDVEKGEVMPTAFKRAIIAVRSLDGSTGNVSPMSSGFLTLPQQLGSLEAVIAAVQPADPQRPWVLGPNSELRDAFGRLAACAAHLLDRVSAAGSALRRDTAGLEAELTAKARAESSPPQYDEHGNRWSGPAWARPLSGPQWAEHYRSVHAAVSSLAGSTGDLSFDLDLSSTVMHVQTLRSLADDAVQEAGS